MPPARPVSIGDIVEIYCSKCRLNLDASVAALIDGQIVKVMCRTCVTEVKFKPPADMKEKKNKAIEKLMRMQQKKRQGPPEVETVKPPPLRELWDELTEKVDVRRAKVYERTRKYAVNDAILHKEHGMGVVHDIGAESELNVLFRDGFVRLESDRPPLDD